MLQLAYDIGGTFTDLVLLDTENGTLDIWKVPTTPDSPDRAVAQALAARIDRKSLNPSEVTAAFHATTIATNAILERKGSATALITTKGFRDILLIGREKRSDTYNLHFKKAKPLVRRSDIFEVDERVAFDGSVVTPLREQSVRDVAAMIRDKGYASVAVVLLHSYANPAHEERIEKIVSEIDPDIAISLSSRVSPKYREYERTSTTVASAYVKPLVGQYLKGLTNSNRELGINSELSIMQSNGGLVSSELASSLAIRIVESGPAAGVLMCAEIGRQIGVENLLTFDMGGTTAKLGAIDRGRAAITPTFEVDTVNYARGSGLPLNIPAIELLEIGAGGGSLARIAAGLIAVGPESAGAQPGPVCYRRGGTKPTITDADLVLGYIDPEYFNGGAMTLDHEGAAAAIAGAIGAPLKLSLDEAAWGIHSIANANMERAMRMVSLERGRDPRHYAMIAFGGAGPLHACRLARALHIPQVIVPSGAGVGSALGLLFAKHQLDALQTKIVRLGKDIASQAADIFAALEARTAVELGRLKGSGTVKTRRSAWMRLVGQGYEIRVELPPGPVDEKYVVAMEEAFRAAYEREYGYSDRDAAIEVIDWYVVAEMPAQQRASGASLGTIIGAPQQRTVRDRDAYFPEAGGRVKCRVVNRYDMTVDAITVGPALIEERESTTVILPGDTVRLSEAGHLVIASGGPNER
jgi:N-methylhydantoinase A